MRFRAPPRCEVDASVFDRPVFDGVQPWRGWLTGTSWPTLEDMNASLDAHGSDRRDPRVGPSLRFVTQDAATLGDGLHYEQRIAEHGQIATRDSNWHDLFNALIWLRYPQMKRAMNARQVADIARVGTRCRTRAQDALTQFDEAGVVVTVRADDRTDSLVEAWGRHDWARLFGLVERSCWRIDVVGHALLEHALCADRLLVGKALLVLSPGADADRQDIDGSAIDLVAACVAAGALLNDPQELRPLPMMGLPGWHPRAGEAAFYREGECFQPVRAGRHYPDPLWLNERRGVPGLAHAST